MSSPADAPALAAPALRVDNAVKTYGELRALDGVSFTVERGIFGLLGGNGAGKSTLMKAILHLVDLDTGTIEVAGIDSKRRSVEARRQIGYLPEEPRLYQRLTGNELLDFVAGVRGLDNAAERRDLLAELDGERAGRLLIGECSLGMRKKVGLVSALMGKPRLVLLDEPLNGLDTESMRRLRLLIERMAAAGTTFVLSSHVMSFVERVCQRMAVLRQGRLVALGDGAELRRVAEMPDMPFEDVFLRLAVDPAPEVGG